MIIIKKYKISLFDNLHNILELKHILSMRDSRNTSIKTRIETAGMGIYYHLLNLIPETLPLKQGLKLLEHSL